MALAPIVLFVYNRPDQTRKTLEALEACELAKDSLLYVYCDGPKKDATNEQRNAVNAVRLVIREKAWCKDVRIQENDQNLGLAASVIKGVTEVVNEHGKVIVLEDDLIIAKGFLKYMNTALDRYADCEEVFQVSGFMDETGTPPQKISFFLPLTVSWGWGTWARAWKYFDPECVDAQSLLSNREKSAAFDLDNTVSYSSMLKAQLEGKFIDSWAIRWYYSVFIHGGLVLFPDKTLVRNEGTGETATHTKQLRVGQDFDPEYFISVFPEARIINHDYFRKLKSARSGVLSYHKHPLKNWIKKMFQWA